MNNWLSLSLCVQTLLHHSIRFAMYDYHGAEVHTDFTWRPLLRLLLMRGRMTPTGRVLCTSFTAAATRLPVLFFHTVMLFFSCWYLHDLCIVATQQYIIVVALLLHLVRTKTYSRFFG